MLSDISVNSTSHVLQCRLLQTAATNYRRLSLLRTWSWPCKHPLLVIVATNQACANARQGQHLHVAKPLLSFCLFLFFSRAIHNQIRRVTLYLWKEQLLSVCRISVLSPLCSSDSEYSSGEPHSPPLSQRLSSPFVQSFFNLFTI